MTPSPRSSGVRKAGRRPLHTLPFDPLFNPFHDPIVCKVPYEAVAPGPVGRLVKVVDFDSSTGQWLLPPLDLESPAPLIGQGLAPSERDVRSHQQMVYAVAIRVLETFEVGSGRAFDWLEQLSLLPHAFDGANAFQDSDLFAVLFGVFQRAGHLFDAARRSSESRAAVAHTHLQSLPTRFVQRHAIAVCRRTAAVRCDVVGVAGPDAEMPSIPRKSLTAALDTADRRLIRSDQMPLNGLNCSGDLWAEFEIT